MPGTKPPGLPSDLRELLAIFNDLGVKYLVIGGVAYGYYAQPRYTKDLDLFVSAAPANAALVYRGLAKFGMPLAGITEADLTDKTASFRFGREPAAVGILPGVPGLEFEDAWERRLSGVVDERRGLEAHLVSKEDLIASKLASGRPRDLGDVDDIRRAERAVKAKRTRN